MDVHPDLGFDASILSLTSGQPVKIFRERKNTGAVKMNYRMEREEKEREGQEKDAGRRRSS